MKNNKYGGNSVTRKIIIISLALFILIVTGTTTFAVEKGKISQTAEGVAVYRAIGSMDTDDKIRNNDNYAEKFVPLNRWSLYLMEPIVAINYPRFKRLIKTFHNSAYFYINARTKHIDAILADALKNGITQVVNMGAGYDSRAYRFHEVAPNVKFFEVDLPETQADKIKMVKEILGKLPDWVTYCPIDFNIQTLEGELRKAGFDEAKKTLFIWEGVTPYISADAVGGTLRFITEHSAPGSSIVFDYIIQPVVEKDYRYYGARAAAEAVASYGEPITFGIYEGEAESYVNQKGLSLISDLGPQELTQKYLIRSNGKVDGRMHGFLRIAYANVPVKTLQEELMKKPYKAVNRGPSPTSHTVAVPVDIQAFFDQYNKDFLTHEFWRIMASYSEKYLDDGATKTFISYYWLMVCQVPSVKAITSSNTILTDLQINGDIARYSGFTKTNMGYDLAEGIMIKENGQWKLYGNQKKADED
jgi:methyltransferase (TIGR00027 family)